MAASLIEAIATSYTFAEYQQRMNLILLFSPGMLGLGLGFETDFVVLTLKVLDLTLRSWPWRWSYVASQSHGQGHFVRSQVIVKVKRQ